jgi:SdpI/YfhL protein family
MLALKILFVASGLLLTGLSIPMILGKVPPNGLYGFRVKKTMENPEIWYVVNTYSGKWLLLTSLLLVLAAIGFSFVPNISLDMYSYAVLGVWAVAFVIALAASVRYLRSL